MIPQGDWLAGVLYPGEIDSRVYHMYLGEIDSPGYHTPGRLTRRAGFHTLGKGVSYPEEIEKFG